eukprot:TRINITY_DN89410_c0_g1_i1.p1 TRINITY_DN89410_c0_g1~~TRINITY_DN89410_c0_g1_i1.p1  ORF type:complete len:483 (-),score=65.25 TRINITY_DN89410_c0_g1_i1:29-1477(-)
MILDESHPPDVDLFGEGIDENTLHRLESAILGSEGPVKNVNLDHNHLEDSAMMELMRILTVHTAASLVSLNLAGNRLRDPGAEVLADNCPSLGSLIHLNLANNEISELGMTKIAKAVHSQLPLQSLDLADNMSLTVTSVGLVSELNKTTLRSLRIAGNRLIEKGAYGLIYLGEQPVDFGEQLYREGLDGEPVPFTGLEQDGSLQALDMSRCLCGPNLEGTNIDFSIARLVEKSFLVDLNVSSNPLLFQERDVRQCLPHYYPSEPCPFSLAEKSGFTYIPEALVKNTCLTRLDISNTSLYNELFGDILLALASNSTLLSLNVADNDLDDHAVPATTNFLRSNDSLTHLDLTLNEFNGPGIGAIVDALEQNSVMKSFHVSDRRGLLEDALASRVASKLEQNRPPTVFTVFCLESDSDSIAVLCTALSGQEHVLRMGRQDALGSLQAALASKIQPHERVELVSPDGSRLLDYPDDSTVAEVLQLV